MKRDPYTIVIPVYEGVDLLDVAAPYEMFGWMREQQAEKRTFEIWLAAENTELLHTRDCFPFHPHKSFEEIGRVDVLWTPGAGLVALKRAMRHQPLLDFLRRAAETAEWVASVCEGALVQASAGLLDGYKATTHWAFKPCLERDFPRVDVVPGYPRFVVDRDRVTGGGISSGLDEALKLIELIAGEEAAVRVRSTTQYFPIPPVTGEIPGAKGCLLDKV